MAVKKAAAKKAPARKAPARKTAARKAAAKKAAGRKSAAKKAVKKALARKAPARKTAAKKTTARKTTAKKTTARKSTAKRAPARKTAAKKTTARKTAAKQAPARKTAAKKTTARKTARQEGPARKTAAKKTTARKTAARKAPARKTTARKARPSGGSTHCGDAVAAVVTSVGACGPPSTRPGHAAWVDPGRTASQPVDQVEGLARSRPATAPCWASCQAIRAASTVSAVVRLRVRRRPPRPMVFSSWLWWHSRASTLTASKSADPLDVVGEIGLPQQERCRAVRLECPSSGRSGDPGRRPDGVEGEEPGGPVVGVEPVAPPGVVAQQHVGPHRPDHPGHFPSVVGRRSPARRRRSRGSSTRSPSVVARSYHRRCTAAAARHSRLR